MLTLINTLKKRGIVSKNFLKADLCLVTFGLIVLLLIPVRTTLIKLCIVLLSFAFWLLILSQNWRKRKLRNTLLGITAFSVLFCCMPSRTINESKLREQYVRSLGFYESRPYLWGAENFLAVDCSGLIRQGYIDANMIYGLKTFNGALVRKAMLIWWNDSSAKAMRDEYRGRTKRYIESPSINQLDHSRILPGDFAVTQNGVHCLAYLGDGHWIQADPNPNKVTINTVPEENSSWFRQPIYIMRWSEFEN